MGITTVIGTVTGPTDKQETLEFLVDSGAMYTALPEVVWRGIELEPKRRQRFSLADGTTIERRMSDCRISLPHGETPTPVILGEANDSALLGVITFEELGLMLNPLTREVLPMRMTL